ncbi:hypothetical protein, partial [Treponema porcinum]|uniref:hypothetical protein n=1 Tax=Treponema porcinum TaxID=261392 RepID=UPI0023569101
RFSVLGSRFSVLGSRFSVLGSRFSVLGSRFSVLGSRFSVLGSLGKLYSKYIDSILEKFKRHGTLLLPAECCAFFVFK